MCGLTGFFITRSDQKRSALQATAMAMNNAIAHRGPDGADVWIDPDLALALAHRRLAIVDLSEHGAQPMHSVSGRFVIVFNGEIYNFLEIRRTLEDMGHAFRGRSDTEVMLAAIEQWGLNQALQKFSGMFAFALWDRKDRILHFARDRMGKKPLYIGWNGKHSTQALVFGSELKALRAYTDTAPPVHPAALEQSLHFGFISPPLTIYEGIWMLPPGCRMSLKVEALQPRQDLSDMIEPYWQATAACSDARLRPFTGSLQDAAEAFEALLSDCVRDRMISDVPLGAFLSGGIDSSCVVALMQKQAGRPVKTYTIGFEEESHNEAAYAAKVAAHLGTDHHEMRLGGADALALVPRLPEMFDEPFADISGLPTYLVSRFARRDVTVALSGDGGDEMLGGYNRHILGPYLWTRMRMIPRPLRQAVSGAICAVPAAQWDRLRPHRADLGANLHKVAALFAQPGEQALYQRFLSTGDKSVLAGGYAAQHPVFAAHSLPQDLTLAEKMMLWDTLVYLPDDILTKVDRASMACSLEARAPLLDRRVFDFVWRLPPEYKIHGKRGKILLRQVLQRHVPTELFERPKQGFSIPIAQWLRGPLQEWAEDMLSDRALDAHGLLDKRAIQKLWAEHQSGRRSHGQRLWAILMVQAWHRHWCEDARSFRVQAQKTG